MLAPGTTVVGVRFRPGAAPSVFGIPASELVDLTVAACLRLTGMSPGAFLAAAGDSCGCGHDHSASYAPVLRARPVSSNPL